MVDNFLSATLDARLVAAEVDLQEEVDNISFPVLDSILAKYLGVKDAAKINVEPRRTTDPNSASLNSSGHDLSEIVKREEVTEEGVFEELPFVEVDQGLCIKLEPP